MSDLIDLAYDLGDLMDSMPEFSTDYIYYTWDDWENEDRDVAELRFYFKTGKWSSNEIFDEFFGRGSSEIVKKITQPEARELRNKMTKIAETDNNN